MAGVKIDSNITNKEIARNQHLHRILFSDYFTEAIIEYSSEAVKDVKYQ